MLSADGSLAKGMSVLNFNKNLSHSRMDIMIFLRKRSIYTTSQKDAKNQGKTSGNVEK